MAELVMTAAFYAGPSPICATGDLAQHEHPSYQLGVGRLKI